MLVNGEAADSNDPLQTHPVGPTVLFLVLPAEKTL